MLRNSIAVVAGVLLSFALSFAGSRLAWLLIIGNVDYSENKDAIVRWMLWLTFGVGPGVAIIVGAFVGFVVRRSGWWFGGVAVVPIFIYGFIRGARGVEIVLSVVYVGLAFVAAFVVSRFKRLRPA
jgi:hypothetical protein